MSAKIFLKKPFTHAKPQRRKEIQPVEDDESFTGHADLSLKTIIRFFLAGLASLRENAFYVFFFFMIIMLLVFPLPVLAEQCPLSEIVVSASKWEEDKKDVTRDISVITAKQISESGETFVADLLRRQSDLNVVSNGGFGKTATLFLRGGSGKQTLVLIDGVRLNSPSSGSADLSGLLTYDVERIEIIKGPQSTLYGSEAMAGVVNIITRKGAAGTMAALSIEGGSFSTVSLYGFLSGGGNFGNCRLTASRFNTEGISVAKSGKEPDAYTNTTVSARAGFSPSERAEFDLNIRYIHDVSELDGFVYGSGLVDDPDWVQKRDAWLVSATSRFSPFDIYDQKLSLSFQEEKLRSEDPDAAWNNSRINTGSYNVEWQHAIFPDPLTLAGGFAFRNESAENVDKFDESADNRAGYLNGKVRLFDDSLIVEAGVRFDSHESFGGALTYRTGILYRLRPFGIRFRANHGTGFRAPSLNELYYPNYGNRDLEAEKCFEYDAGLDKDVLSGKLNLSARWFLQRYTNLIQTNFSTFTAENIGRARIEGVELEASVRPVSELLLKSSYTHMKATDLDTRKRLTRRPNNKVVTSVEYSTGKITTGIEHIFVSSRFDSASDGDLPSYSLVNLKASYTFRKFLTVFARLENLFDKDYEEAGGYGAPGMAVYGGVRAEF